MLVLLLGLTCTHASPPGVIQTVWGNSAGAGDVNTTTIVATPRGSWDGSSQPITIKSSSGSTTNPSNGAVSVEYLGMLTSPESGPVTFACNVTSGTVVMCQSLPNNILFTNTLHQRLLIHLHDEPLTHTLHVLARHTANCPASNPTRYIRCPLKYEHETNINWIINIALLLPRINNK